ncbi:TetR family transcriptional regulator [Arthrobacter woluwensis]|uniref:TetR/AcrR family transcriptional regulator n=1 Tax=Arthrobacter woluwensis TaxID=156980 RepID=UPI000D13A427|nr:TetR/AcrR family transcriptional regulator [Arthrobacter woluwensis]PSS42943.1 TetR family transcriptional regulator [Arthrobacter woluwensis]
MTSFQRARTDEQREVRRRVILEAAVQMLQEMPVSSLSLNELSKRVGLARSNVLRYFESREAILLELLGAAASRWLALRIDELPGRIDPGWDLRRRQEVVATDLAAAFDADAMLCELLSAQAGVLEHNVSTEAAIRYRRAVMANVEGLGSLLCDVIPELEVPVATQAAATMVVLAGAIWTHTHPGEAMLAAYAAEPALGVFQNFPEELGRAFLIVLRGALA